MVEIIKPIPMSHLHGHDDETLQSLVRTWREMEADKKLKPDICRKLVDDVYKVLGYRCALEYLNKYGD